MLHFNCQSNLTPLLLGKNIPFRPSPFLTRRGAAPLTSHMASSGVGTPLSHTQRTIYLDYNATTPIFSEASAAMLPFVTTHFGNPSSSHPYGRVTRAALDHGRQQVATLLNASPSEIYFTSCGTESDNWVIFGATAAFRRSHPGLSAPPHVVSSSIEHPAILEALRAYHALGLLDFTLVGVNSAGLVDAGDVASAIIPGRTALVTIMHSNNEVGTLQPISDIASVAHAKGVPVVHTDAAQSAGKVAVDVAALGVDAATVVGHKFGASKGVAALYIRGGVEIDRFLLGGGQEGGRRAGTENVLLIAGMGAAAEVASRELPQTAAHMAALRDALQARLIEGLPEGAAVVNGPADRNLRLPNTLSVSFPGVVASQLLGRLSEELAASAGAACHSAEAAMHISGVLEAMGLPYEVAVGTVRLSVGRHTTLEEVTRGAELILREVERAKGRGSVSNASVCVV